GAAVSEPRADRGPRAGSPRGVVVATGQMFTSKLTINVMFNASLLQLPLWPVATASRSDGEALFVQSPVN
ncbi:MAG TPA: hypothetical protein VMZ30_12110, partial [Pyrinomonadaceae bacterium]|nr:hypothetical protein [Pyrinomonadaceae bacterium]